MINLIQLKNHNILEQLHLEEYLLKNTSQSFCLINEGTQSCVILGITNKEEQLINIINVKKDKIPIIKRFTAGGTVFVDQQTIFITFIFSKKNIKIDLFPQTIIKWAESFYKKALDLKYFSSKENDFVINNKKIGGNALYIKKDRFLLHTSFLLDYEIKKMNRYLLLPQKAPKYRNNRSHDNFLTPLKDFFSKENFILKIKKELDSVFKINIFDHSDLKFNKSKNRTKLLI